MGSVQLICAAEVVLPMAVSDICQNQSNLLIHVPKYV